MSKRPEKTHYVPPGRRPHKTPGVSVVAAAAAGSHHSPATTPRIAPPPPAAIPPSSTTTPLAQAPLRPTVAAHTPSYINTASATRNSRNHPTTSTSHAAAHAQLQQYSPPPPSTHSHLESSITPASPPHTHTHPRNTTTTTNNNTYTSDAMRSGHPSPHMRTIVPRRDSYDVGIAPGNGHHRVEVIYYPSTYAALSSSSLSPGIVCCCFCCRVGAACSALPVAIRLLPVPQPNPALHLLRQPHDMPNSTCGSRAVQPSESTQHPTPNAQYDRANFSDAQVRDLRSNDFPVYRSDRIESSPRLSHATKYDGSHLGRSARNYDDRYGDVRPTFRGKAQYQAPSPMMAPVRILRNPDRERERARESRDEFVEEHGSRQFITRAEPRAYPAAAPLGPSKARFLGDSIHTLAPATSLSERCERYIKTLHPERPDPPTQDEPYEYPYTQPCDPTTLPEIKNGRNFPIPADMERPVYVTESIRTPSIEHDYFVPGSKIRPEKRRRHRPRRRDEYDEASSIGEDCARRMYRLHT
ncbi:hypothetical protein BZA05DRAFT_199773 [Tricharina praecox]|uniref:uncharacterized protein n=1 Tax=Tricharina praecox TaxID=43433 RepID=UPI00221FEB99|nr:uncharacterized protein BZA05DRAFT_199773 [Tricharina praecox]KAI5856397.1 hypothetical protein BZA05DRAFT_199773 [Tricharina praecox]